MILDNTNYNKLCYGKQTYNIVNGRQTGKRNRNKGWHVKNMMYVVHVAMKSDCQSCVVALSSPICGNTKQQA